MKKFPWLLLIPLPILSILDIETLLYTALLILPVLITWIVVWKKNCSPDQTVQNYWHRIKCGWRKLHTATGSVNQNKKLIAAFVVAEGFLLLVFPLFGLPLLLITVHFILADT